MTPDIEALAREAGVTHLEYKNWYPAAAVAAIVAKAVEQEREQCAKVCDKYPHWIGEEIAEAIRARGESSSKAKSSGPVDDDLRGNRIRDRHAGGRRGNHGFGEGA